MTSSTSNSNPNNDSLLKPDFQREFRLGLVLYGGISLAIYMNGICREFYNAMRGRGIYKLFKALTGSDIVIDIVSGTSAGGINGVLLSYALANSDNDKKEVVEFEQFAQIWRNSGDIDQLLRQPSQGKPTSEVNSVLDGEEYYQEEFEKIFRNAGNYPKSAPKDDWYSDFRELDLFITGTDVLGKIYKILDDTGKVIDIKDHRAVFHLKHRQDRKRWIGDPFRQEDETTYKALAKLCRITSCFPVAFPVVTVKLEPSPADPDCEADKKLVEWGKLKNRILPPIESTKHGHQLYFIDGGVLENRPFRHTIKAIDRRTAYDDVDRKLFYIDPNPDLFVDSPDFRKMAKPNILRIVTDSLINLPSYQSIGRDIENIDEFNEKIKRYRAIRQDIEKDFDSLSSQKKVGFLFIFLLLIKNDQHKIALLLINKDFDRSFSYLRCRFLGLFDRLLPIMLNIGKYQGQDENKKFIEQIAQQLKTELGKQENLENIAQQIKYLDLQYAYRKYCFLISKISRIVQNHDKKNNKDQLTEAEIQELRCLKYKLTWQLELIKIIQESLDEILSELKLQEIILKDQSYSEFKLDNLYIFLIDFHKYLLGQELKLSSSSTQLDLLKKYFERIERINKDNFISLKSDEYEEIFKAIYKLPICEIYTDKKTGIIKEISDYLFNNHDNKADSILKEIYDFSGTIIESTNISKDIKEKLRKLNNDFDKIIDSTLYPYEYLTNLEGKSPIELVRISPEDADLGFGKGKGLNDKLAGDQFRAFGGFFKKSWRSNDVLWGRLDGLNRLLEALVTKESIKHFQDFVQGEWGNSKQVVIACSFLIQIGLYRLALLFLQDYQHKYIERLVEQSIESSTKKSITKKLIELFDLLQKESNNGKELDDLLSKLLEQLVEEGQREIIRTDLIQVMEDAIDQQIQWSDIQQKEDWLTTGQNIVQRLFGNIQSFINITNTISQAEEVCLIQEIDEVINSLYKLKAFREKDLQEEILEVKDRLEKIEQKINKKLQSKNSGQNDSQENQLRQLNKLNSFFEKLETKSKNNTLNLFQKQNDKQLKQLFQQSLNLDDQGAEKIIDIIISEKISDEKWYEFLKRILRASKQELKQIESQKKKEIENKLNELNQKIEPVLDDVFNSIRPKYDPIIGTLEPTLTMWTATALAEESLNNLKSDDDKADYFQNLYRVSQEELGKDVPSSVRFHLLRKSLLVFRDILVSQGDKEITDNLLLRLFNFVLSIYINYKSYKKWLNFILLILLVLLIVCSWKLWLTKVTTLGIIVVTITFLVVLILRLLLWLLHSQVNKLLNNFLKNDSRN